MGSRSTWIRAHRPAGLPWIPAKRSYSLLDDGLAQPWRGRVWLNPPYGPRTPLWLQTLAEHGDGIALVFTRTDTGWFHRWVAPRADAVCFIRRQIKFVKGSAASAGDLFDDPVAGAVEGQAKASAGAASMLVAYGDDNAGSGPAQGLFREEEIVIGLVESKRIVGALTV